MLYFSQIRLTCQPQRTTLHIAIKQQAETSIFMGPYQLLGILSPDPHDCLKADLPGDVAVQAVHEGPVSGWVSCHVEIGEMVDAAAWELTDPWQGGKVDVLRVKGKEVHRNLRINNLLQTLCSCQGTYRQW